jgi:hypothetical protein
MNTLGSHPGAILFRLSVMIIIIAILVVIFFRYSDSTQKELERQSVMQTKRIIDSSLAVVFASYAVKGRLNELNQIEGANPFVFLKEYSLLPAAYRGETGQSGLTGLDPGWYYSRVTGNVVYIPRFLDEVELYAVVLNYDDVNQSGRFDAGQDAFRNLQFIKKPRQ